MPDKNDYDFSWDKYSQMVLKSLRHNENDIKDLSERHDKFEDDIHNRVSNLKDKVHDIELDASNKYGDFRVLKTKIFVGVGIIVGIPGLILTVLQIINLIVK